MEEWRGIPSLPTHEASNLGRVRRIGSGRPTYGSLGGGRPKITFRKRNHRVSRLVCEAFHGPAPAGAVAMHEDDNSANNRADNLKWGMQKQNLNTPTFLAYCRSRTGDLSPRRKGAACS